MNYSTRRPLSRVLLTAGLALVGTLASFAATTSPVHAGTAGYTATLTTAVAAPQSKVLNDVIWKCEGDTCRGPIDGAAPKNTCAQVVKTFGQISKFATPKGEFSAEQLQRCNASA